MHVPFLNVKESYEKISEQVDKAVLSVLRSGNYISGPEVQNFEDKFAKSVGANFSVGTGNGYDSLVLSLKALEIGRGDEVLVPTNTFIATWLAVSAVGAKPIPVEPDQETYTITADGCNKVLTRKSKAIIPVHLYGQPVDLKPIIRLAQDHGLKVIEDAAQAHGARYFNKPVGGLSDLTCWSFYPGKNLGALGDAGAVTGNDTELIDKVRFYANYGSEKKYDHKMLGINSRLDPIQAAILSVKLEHIDTWTNSRRKIAGRYLHALSHTNYILPTQIDNTSHVWHLFVIRSQKRNELCEFLDINNIQCLIHYPKPPHLQNAYKHLGYQRGTFPIAEHLSETVLSLPMCPHMTEEQNFYVIEKMLEFAQNS